MAYTPLYSYTASEPVLLGGTHSQFSADSGTTWKNLRGCQELGDIGDIAESAGRISGWLRCVFERYAECDPLVAL